MQIYVTQTRLYMEYTENLRVKLFSPLWETPKCVDSYLNDWIIAQNFVRIHITNLNPSEICKGNYFAFKSNSQSKFYLNDLISSV